MNRRLSVVAHRGLSATYPENTLLAFRQALEIGADTVEFDVHLTRDRQLVVSNATDVIIGALRARGCR